MSSNQEAAERQVDCVECDRYGGIIQVFLKIAQGVGTAIDLLTTV